MAASPGARAAGPVLRGKRVCLRPPQAGDAAVLSVWFADAGLCRLTGHVCEFSVEQAREFIERVAEAEDRAWFMVCRSGDGRAVGECGLLRIFRPWRTADVSMIIGDPADRGQGYATEAMELLLEYAFGELGLHRLAIGVVGFNERALNWWAKMGFRKEGAQRDGYYCDGAFHDFVMMSLLEGEYRRA